MQPGPVSPFVHGWGQKISMTGAESEIAMGSHYFLYEGINVCKNAN